MADQSTLGTDLLNLGLTGVNTWLGSNALNQAQQQLAQSYGTAGQYVQAAQQQAAGYAKPYMEMGTQAIPQYMQAAQGVGSPYTMAQFQASPYYQAGMSAQKQAADQIRAQAGATGMYGSGNVANALQKNAMDTMLGAYGTAEQADLRRRQAGVNAMYQPMALGQSTTNALGTQTMDSAKYMAGLAQALGAARAGGTLGQQAGTGSLLSALGSVAPALLRKLQSGSNLTGQEQAAVDAIAADIDLTGRDVQSIYSPGTGGFGGQYMNWSDNVFNTAPNYGTSTDWSTGEQYPYFQYDY